MPYGVLRGDMELGIAHKGGAYLGVGRNIDRALPAGPTGPSGRADMTDAGVLLAESLVAETMASIGDIPPVTWASISCWKPPMV